VRNLRRFLALGGAAAALLGVIAKGCSTFRCAWAISMAYPGKTWRRVR
jgi:hypothetical protein